MRRLHGRRWAFAVSDPAGAENSSATRGDDTLAGDRPRLWSGCETCVHHLTGEADTTTSPTVDGVSDESLTMFPRGTFGRRVTKTRRDCRAIVSSWKPDGCRRRRACAPGNPAARSADPEHRSVADGIRSTQDAT